MLLTFPVTENITFKKPARSEKLGTSRDADPSNDATEQRGYLFFVDGIPWCLLEHVGGGVWRTSPSTSITARQVHHASAARGQLSPCATASRTASRWNPTLRRLSALRRTEMPPPTSCSKNAGGNIFVHSPLWNCSTRYSSTIPISWTTSSDMIETRYGKWMKLEVSRLLRSRDFWISKFLHQSKLKEYPGGVRVGSVRCDPYWCERLAPRQACQKPRAAPTRPKAPKRSRGSHRSRPRVLPQSIVRAWTSWAPLMCLKGSFVIWWSGGHLVVRWSFGGQVVIWWA